MSNIQMMQLDNETLNYQYIMDLIDETDCFYQYCDEDNIESTNKLKIRILNNIETMKDVLNQESILVEIYKPEVLFL